MFAGVTILDKFKRMQRWGIEGVDASPPFVVADHRLPIDGSVRRVSMSLPIKESLPPKHTKLRRLAIVANVLAWIVLVLNTIQATLAGLAQFSSLSQVPAYSSQDTVLTVLDLPITVASRLLIGFALWLVLRGVSLGLNMLIETDLNYRGRSQGEGGEQHE